MNKSQEQVLVATLAGLIIAGAAALAVTPASAAGYSVDQKAQVTGVAFWDKLNIRKWPAWYSKKVGVLSAQSWVWVDRCVEVEAASDWCKVDRDGQQGWVNASYLTVYNPYADNSYGVPQN